MKLVELLANCVQEWPEGISCMVQDSDGKICTCSNGFPDPRYGDWTICGPISADTPVDWVDTGSNKQDLAADQASAIVTPELWQAERDRQKGGEWKRHRGGKQPVADDVRVEVKLRCGDIQQYEARAFAWPHTDCDVDANIMQYRIISQPQAEEVEVKDTNIGTISYKISVDQIAGPLAWRDTIIHCQAIIEDCEREIERNRQRLADEGFSLIQTITDVRATLGFDQWQIGDWVTSKVDYSQQFTKDKKYKVTRTHISLGENRIEVEEDDLGSSNGWLANHFVFHSRP